MSRASALFPSPLAGEPPPLEPGPRLALIRVGMEAWVRERMLPRLVPVSPEEVADRSPAGRIAVLRRLTRALVGERARGRAGHWSYSLDRHLGLVQAVAAERAALTGIRGRGAEPELARRRRREGDGSVHA